MVTLNFSMVKSMLTCKSSRINLTEVVTRYTYDSSTIYYLHLLASRSYSL